MRVLFLDKYCPGHFRHLAGWVAADEKHEGMFLSEYRRKDFVLPGQVSVKVGRSSGRQNPAELLRQMSHRAEAFADVLNRLKSKGFMPDAICLGASSGCGLYVNDVFPGVPVLGFFDHFHPSDDQAPGAAALRMGNLFQLDALQKCSVALTGSKWQKDSFPEPWRGMLRVLPEGVDTRHFSPGPADMRITGRDSGNLITYISRTLSTEGGFPTFYTALAEVLEQVPGSHAIIVGYPEKDGGGRSAAFEKLLASTPLASERVRFVNFCTSEQYLAVLRSSRVHVSLAGANVFSSGLLEAMSCGCLMVASDTAPAREVAEKGGGVLLTPPGDAVALAGAIIRALREGDALAPLRLSARHAMEQHYCADELLKQRVNVLEAICSKKPLIKSSI